MEFPTNFRWKKGAPLGSGGQATVFEVEDTSRVLKGTYALKPLKEDATPQAYERFLKEVTAIKGLDHANIIKIIESSSPGDKFHYYVMEYIKDAKPLKHLLRTKNNPFHNEALKSLNLFKQLASVIGTIESARVVHRDLSPANVLILPDETIKVIDFGICQIDGDETITLVDEGLGTRNYTAPELEAGAGGIASFKSDLYSAGKILWSAVTNRSAFAKESLVFNNLSMYKLRLDVMTWHLHHIFEGTIRDNPNHRFDSPAVALDKVMLVSGAISMKGFPLELILLEHRCKFCFIGEVASYPGWPAQTNHPFQIPDTLGVIPVVCNHCRSWDVIDKDGLTKELQRRAKLN